jgi:hypothetical protein
MSKETFDPDPRRHRRHKGPRKGIEPKGLKRWRLAHRTHDPSSVRRRKPWHRGPRGGKYWKGPTKRRYDTPRFARVRRYGRRIGGKAENFINKYGGWLGALSALGFGFYTAITKYTAAHGDAGYGNYWATLVGGTRSDGVVRVPEISHLWQNEPPDGSGWTPIKYLQYKFGLYQPGGDLSSWAIPFWASLIAYVASKIPLPIPSWARIRKPLGKIAAPALLISTIGALALPGCPNGQTTSTNESKAGIGRRNVGLPSPPINIQYAGAY